MRKSSRKTHGYLAAFVFIFTPHIVFGLGCSSLLQTASVGGIAELVSALVPFAMAGAILFFLWAYLQSYLADDEEEELESMSIRMSWAGAMVVFTVVLMGLTSTLDHMAATPPCDATTSQ